MGVGAEAEAKQVLFNWWTEEQERIQEEDSRRSLPTSSGPLTKLSVERTRPLLVASSFSSSRRMTRPTLKILR
jgi:hypothetical protein